MSLVVAAAVKLGEVLVKSAFTAITGKDVIGDMASGLESVLGDKLLGTFETRRAKRLLEDIADTAAKRIAGAYGHEFRDLSEKARAVVVDSVREAFTQTPGSDMVIAADFDSRAVERRVRELTGDLLKSRHFGEDETILYGLVLGQCCVELVGAVRGMSDLADRAVPEILDRLTELKGELREAPRRALADAAQEGDSAFAEKYREYVNQSMDMVTLGNEWGDWYHEYPLSVAYLSLPARASDGQVTTIEDAFAGQENVLIQAHCGCGKTTYLHRLFTLTARRGLTGALTPLNRAIPFYLPLRRYADGTRPQADDLFAGAANDIQGQMPHGWMQRQLSEGESLVLINGVDEVPVEVRRPVLDWVANVTANFERPRYVLTSRPGAVPEDWVRQAGFEVIELLPMGPGDVATFIRRWHDALASKRPNDVLRLNECATALIEALARSHALRELAMNPLTCALMCALHYECRVELPGQWLDLIRQVIDILVGERDQVRRVADSLTIMSREQRIVALQDVAYWMTTEEMAHADPDDVRQRIEHLMGVMDIPTEDGQAGQVLDYLTARSGLIHVRADGWLGFSSPIVRDYLAAKEVVLGRHIRSLLSNAARPDRQHLVVMVAGNAQLAAAEELVSGLLARLDGSEGTRECLRVLVHECLREVSALGAELRQRAEACCSPLAPRTLPEAEVLAASGPLAIDVLAAQPTDELDVALALIHAAIRIGGNDALPFLAQFANDDRPGVCQALRDGQPYFAGEDYARLVLTHAGGGERDE